MDGNEGLGQTKNKIPRDKILICKEARRSQKIANIKAAPWDDINFRCYFRTEVVYPTDQVFIFFTIFIFLQIF